VLGKKYRHLAEYEIHHFLERERERERERGRDKKKIVIL